MQVPEKKGKASVWFRVTMMLTQCLLLPGPALSALAPYTPYAAGAVAVTASGRQQAKAQRLQWLSRAQEASTCLSASISLFLGLSLPSHRQLCPLVRMSWRGWPRVICAQGGGDTTRSWTTDNDKEGRSGQMCFSHPLQRACSRGGPSGPLLVIRGPER